MRYQEVYNLAQQGYSYQQIADKMGITLKTVYKYNHRCKHEAGKKVPHRGKNVKYKKLELALVEKYGSKKAAARKMGIGYTTLNCILAGRQKPHETTIEVLMYATGLTKEKIFSES